MNLRGSKTEENLKAAFAAESEARNRYTFFGDQARAAGLSHVADVFHELAANEGEHAKMEFDFLGGLGEIRANIEMVAEREHHEHDYIYPNFARTAREEGFTEIADSFERMAKVEGIHEQRFRALLKDLDGVEPFRGKTVLHSRTWMAQVILPNQANISGYGHGGELMKLVDIAAGTAARRHCGRSVVTASVEELSFYKPVTIGSLVLIDARLTFVSRSSMEVKVEMDAEERGTGKRDRAVSAIVIMVAMDQNRRPAEVPPLLISTEEQHRLYEIGKNRYEKYKEAQKKYIKAAT